MKLRAKARMPPLAFFSLSPVEGAGLISPTKIHLVPIGRPSRSTLIIRLVAARGFFSPTL